ncbi:phosphotyrosine protein phosphatase, partial [Mycobacterium tuberculosis]|nr:phosphotyrosine protein phosphatase [Mycobacterium tuberculosis]
MTTNVLILCTHNSARSVLSEGMLNHWAQKLGKDVRAYSAGSAPSGRLNPFALEALTNAGIDTAGYRSKSWDEFVADGAPQMRVVITV